MKKPTFLLIILSFLLVFSLLAVGFMALRRDITFRVCQRAASLFRSADLGKADIATKSVSIKSLKALSASQMLINAEHPIPADFEPLLSEIDGHLVSQEIAAAFTAMQNAVFAQFGEKLMIRSSYRTKAEQEEIYGSLSDDIAAKVGASEHQIGMSLDVYIDGFTGGEILKSAAGRYLHSHAHEFGFILRYPYGKSDVTGISYEPWHFRYVGAPHAEIIYRESLTLEEYTLSFLEPNVYYVSSHYYISRQIPKDGYIQLPVSYESIRISLDNCGGYIVTAEQVNP